MQTCKVDERQLGDWIDKASGSIRYVAPAITDNLAHKICAAEKRTGEKNSVLIELDSDIDRSGYGETTGVRILMENGVTTNSNPGLRIAAITAPNFGVVWSPNARRIDLMERVSVNGFFLEGQERRNLQKLVCKLMGEDQILVSQFANDEERKEATTSDEVSLEVIHQPIETDRDVNPQPDETDREVIPAPDEPEINIHPVSEEEVKKVEKDLREHPPRNFDKEKILEVYQGYIGFVEIHVIGATLSESTTLAIPKELTELGLAEELRNNLSEKMRIDLSDRVDLGASEVNKQVDAFRMIFTKQMGKPLGRIYKKSDWKVMQDKWKEINYLVDTANAKILQKLDNTVDRIIQEAAEEWERALYKNSNTSSQPNYSVEEINRMLNQQWINKKRATKVKIEMFAKDLTWETLNDAEVKNKIADAYPELCETGLFKSRKAIDVGD